MLDNRIGRLLDRLAGVYVPPEQSNKDSSEREAVFLAAQAINTLTEGSVAFDALGAQINKQQPTPADLN